MKALVTGGAGFIGHHLVHGLVERGHRVTVLDDLSTGVRSRLPTVDGAVNLIEGDIRDARVLDVAAAECDVVFHEAALASVVRSIDEPLQTNDVNVAGTIAVMLAAARARVARVVFASSSAVYGAAAKLPSAETDTADPRSPYAVGKLAAESYVHLLGQAHGVETVVLRYFNVFGPGQDPKSQYAAVIPRFINAALAGAAATIYGDGEQSRDFVYVDDVVAANLLAASAPSTISGITCNIASGSRRSVTRPARRNR